MLTPRHATARSTPAPRPLARGGRRRGVTLVEVLITIGIIAMLGGVVMVGFGAQRQARLKQTATMIAGAIRVAYTHASAVSRPVRLVFDFDARTVTLEQAQGQMLLRTGERTGGAQGATEAEREALEEAERIVEGPRAPRPTFEPVTAMGFEADSPAEVAEAAAKAAKGRSLASGVQFRQIEVAHEDGAVRAERVYLYFWPGGQTERAAIQLQLGEDADEDDVITILVSPLTGKVEIVAGAVDMVRPLSDEDESEREDNL